MEWETAVVEYFKTPKKSSIKFFCGGSGGPVIFFRIEKSSPTWLVNYFQIEEFSPTSNFLYDLLLCKFFLYETFLQHWFFWFLGYYFSSGDHGLFMWFFRIISMFLNIEKLYRIFDYRFFFLPLLQDNDQKKWQIRDSKKLILKVVFWSFFDWNSLIKFTQRYFWYLAKDMGM